MDWDGLARRLREACSRVVARGDGWVCYAPVGGAIDVRELIVECASGADLDAWAPMHGDLRDEDVLPGGTAGVLHDQWESWDVVVWEWVGRRSSWGGSMGVFDAGDGREYVARFKEDSPYLVVGAIAPAASPAAFQAFIRDLFADNGSAYGIDALGSLPASTELHRPDLLPREVIEEVYRRWMEDAVASGASSWEALADWLDDLEETDDQDLDELFDDDDLEEGDGEDEGDEHARLIGEYCDATVLLVDTEDEDDA
jgi:hypothetical protein